MSELKKNSIQGEKRQQTKSENGRSTTLSQGSSDADQEFKTKKDQKFQFINEQAENWPQWSVGQSQQKSQIQSTKNQVKQPQGLKYPTKDQMQRQLRKIEYQNQMLYSRGYPYSVSVRSKPVSNEKKSFAQNAIDKIKGWFK